MQILKAKVAKLKGRTRTLMGPLRRPQFNFAAHGFEAMNKKDAYCLSYQSHRDRLKGGPVVLSNSQATPEKKFSQPKAQLLARFLHTQCVLLHLLLPSYHNTIRSLFNFAPP